MDYFVFCFSWCKKRRRADRSRGGDDRDRLTADILGQPTQALDTRGFLEPQLEVRSGRPSVSVLPEDFPRSPKNGQFDIGDLIGLGGQGFVFSGVRRSDGRKCAAKAFDLEKVAMAEDDPITAELEALTKLGSHPLIVELLGTFMEDKWKFIVLELVSGGSLHERVFCEGRLDEAGARSVFRQVLMGVGYMHTKRLLHRDLKLKNVLLVGAATPCQIKIIDFGLTSECHEATRSTAVGTPQFAAPEMTDEHYDYAADFWSMGVVLFCALCGHYPIDDPLQLGARLQELLEAMRFKDAQGRSPWHGLSAEAKSLVRGLLTVPWEHWYGPRARLALEGCLRHPWVGQAQPPEWPSAPTPEPPERQPACEVPLQVCKTAVEGCILGPAGGQSGEAECLDVLQRFGKQVVLIQRVERFEPEWLDRLKDETALKAGDVVFYGERRIVPQGQDLCEGAEGASPAFGAFEERLCRGPGDVQLGMAECQSAEVPAAWDNCVLGGVEQAAAGQGWLDFRKNWSHTTVAALLPRQREGSPPRPSICFPGGADVVRAGDTLFLPRRYKDLSADPPLFTAKEWEKAGRIAKRARLGPRYFEAVFLDDLCTKGRARRAGGAQAEELPAAAPAAPATGEGAEDLEVADGLLSTALDAPQVVLEPMEDEVGHCVAGGGPGKRSKSWRLQSPAPPAAGRDTE